MSNQLKTYWVRYQEPYGIPDEAKVVDWPSNMKGWVSGFSENTTIWCARIDALTEEEAKAQVNECYGTYSHLITIDFIQEHAHGWRPSGGRFQE